MQPNFNTQSLAVFANGMRLNDGKLTLDMIETAHSGEGPSVQFEIFKGPTAYEYSGLMV